MSIIRSFRTVALSCLALSGAVTLVGCGQTGTEPAEPDMMPGDGDGDGDGDAMPTRPDAAQVGVEKITAHVEHLASDDLEGRDEGTPGGDSARTYLISKLEECGVLPANDGSYEQAITTGDGTNILGRVMGTDPALQDRVVLVSAHYDHIGVFQGNVYNGAMDNAAGVGQALQVACAFAENPAPRSVMVAFWDAEEPPTFLTDAMGSEFFAANPTLDLLDIDVAIVLDLMGGGLWPGYQGHVGFGAELSPEVAAAFDATPRPEGLDVYRGGLHLFEQRPDGHLPLSDYDGFRDRNVPVLFLTDGTNKTYHQPHDELDSLDPVKMAREGRFLLDLTFELSSAAQQPTFAADGADALADAKLVQALLTDATASGGMVDTLELNSTSADQLAADRDAAGALVERLEGGETATSADFSSLRTGLQRAQCLAGTDYSEFICNFL